MLKVYDLRCEYRINPLGIFSSVPRFSWKIESDKRNVMQTAYSIEVSRDSGFSAMVWESGQIRSGQSLLIPYEGPSLAGCTLYFWRVRVSAGTGEESPWGETACFETALSSPSDWQASFISAEDENAGQSSAGTLVRKEFFLPRPVKSARLYASAKGIYHAYCNGRRVGDQVLSPGWTEYRKRLLYQSYDVGALLSRGSNVLGLMVGPGWYKGDLAGWLSRRNVYGSRTAVIAQLRVEYEDGSLEVIGSDESWKGSSSPVLYSEIYHGERYDARLEMDGWNRPGFDDSGWTPVQIESRDTSLLTPMDGLPVREQEVLKAESLFTTSRGEKVIDFGQNISGWVRFRLRGKAGDRVRIRHAETLDAAGNFYTENLRSAKQTVEYILRGGETETYSPYFTFQGFRYICIDEYPGDIAKEDFEALAVYSDMRPAGAFRCSHELLNRLVSNVRWSMKDNFVDIPTDCPQRDERLGWTGDAQVFVRAASYLIETAPFFRKWLRDLAADQLDDGQVPHVVPDVLRGVYKRNGKNTQDAGATGWGDAAVIVPWTMYVYFADKGILEEQYPAMKKWIGYIRSAARNGTVWDTGFHFGDWVALDAEEGSYFGATPTALIATAFYAYSTELLSKAAAVLGREDEAAEYRSLHDAIVKAYQDEFFTAQGQLSARTQTAHILSLVFGLVPQEYKPQLLETLTALLAERGNHLCTGFLGTPYICRALSENGRLDLAYELLLKEDYPSWLYQVSRGATTIWEHWDGLKPDGTMWSPDMNSFNHYAYGAVADWIFSVAGGLDTDEKFPGFGRILFRPRPGGGISWAETTYESGYGKIGISWKISGNEMALSVIIPPNTSASLTLPGAKPGSIGGIDFAESSAGVRAELGSGTYSFVYTMENVPAS
ncbi:glycoside hydrolase family 78 protein [Treponema sp. OttesenSCG-928-L16]|nr:glycoside hydrolase family 78 protein [Treponema sp. OttesenSCG-928-L16]